MIEHPLAIASISILLTVVIVKIIKFFDIENNK